MPKILIIRFSSIGDIVLTTPMIRCAKTQIVDSEVHFLVKKGFDKVLMGNPYIDKIHIFEGNLDRSLTDMRSEGFDVVIDLQKNLKTRWLCFKLGKTTYSFDKLNIEKWLLTTLKINRLPHKHIVDRYFEASKGLKIINDGGGLDFYMQEEDHIFIDKLIPTSYHVLILGATHFTKRIPDLICQQIIELSSVPIVLVGGNDVIDLGAKLHHQFATKTTNLCGLLSLQQSAAVLSRAQKVITADTGMMHIAAALDCDIDVLWGNTTPSFGMYPYLKTNSLRKFISHEVMGLSCRPCSKLGSTRCPKGHHKCMSQQNLTRLFVDQNPM
jgi:ADP-heptose:LPS heptosyltransferase